MGIFDNKESSTFKVPLTKITEIKEHPNADRLEIAKVYGWEVVVGKGVYKKGDSCLYIPIDSILPNKLEEILFPPGSKITLDKGRVRQIKIRKVVSQGMLVDLNVVKELLPDKMFLEQDYSSALGITKYEPEDDTKESKRGKPASKKNENQYFKKYGGLDNIKWYPEYFKEGEPVIIEEKIHGTHVRAMMAPTSPTTLWDKIKGFFGKLPSHEYVYGSNNVQLQNKKKKEEDYKENLYSKVLDNYKIKEKLQKGVGIHGEIYGYGIQKNYTYGCKQGEHKLIIFDVKITNQDGSFKYLTPEARDKWLIENDLKDCRPPVLYKGQFHMDVAKILTKGKSNLCDNQPVREGIVIRSVYGRKVLKFISEDYLSDKSNTDFH